MNITLIAEKQTIAGKGPGLYLYGPWVTPEVHQAFRMILGANMLDDPAYRARQKCSAFFQGGAHDPNGKFVFIEFWTDDPENWKDFMEIVNEEVTPLIDQEKWKLTIDDPETAKACWGDLENDHIGWASYDGSKVIIGFNDNIARRKVAEKFRCEI